MNDIFRQNVYIRMERADLRAIPQFAVPDGFQIRWYRPGDESNWLAIHEQAEEYADISLDVYQRVFENNETELCQRLFFLLDARNEPIATATAWYEDDFFGLPFGRVHWVSVVPRYQGRGLSKPLLTTVLQRMIELGHEQVFLRTSTARLPAIELYCRFGFVPSLRTPDDRDVWQQLNERLSQPFSL